MIDEFDERKYRLNRLSDMIEEEIGNLERVITSTSLLTRPQTIKRFEEVKREMQTAISICEDLPNPPIYGDENGFKP